ncbi:MAG TPA: hypothetical protein VNO31_31890 [Umezawaea sp.]|nr:hypothetical protein [Umezawaea sp.]
MPSVILLRRPGHHHPYITHAIRRLGDLVFGLAPPDAAPTTRLDLEPEVLFPGGPAA